MKTDIRIILCYSILFLCVFNKSWDFCRFIRRKVLYCNDSLVNETCWHGESHMLLRRAIRTHVGSYLEVITDRYHDEGMVWTSLASSVQRRWTTTHSVRGIPRFHSQTQYLSSCTQTRRQQKVACNHLILLTMLCCCKVKCLQSWDWSASASVPGE